MRRFFYLFQFVLVLFGLMLIGLFATSLLALIPMGNEFLSQWMIFAGQNILAFLLPAILAWRICFKAKIAAATGADVRPSALMLGIAVLVYAVAIPALNQIVYWNQEMHLPDVFSSFERWCREMEDLAQAQTAGLINNTNPGIMLVNILIIGVLTGIGEEFFFRGGLQRAMTYCGIHPHKAIWVSAVIFSLLHFQFFGFIPRALLGAWFGYLFWWSGSIWVNVFAHALNNSLVIVSAWCINKGFLTEEFDMFGVAIHSFPVCAAISASAVVLILYLLRNHLHGKPMKMLENIDQ